MKNLKVKIALALLLVIMSFSTCFAGNEFSDVEGTEYEIPVKILEKLDIIDLYPDGTYWPDNNVTRAELIKILIKAYGLGNAAKLSKGDTIFNDVPSNYWASGYINLAYGWDFLIESADTDFRPDATSTYSEAVTYGLRVLGYAKEIDSRGTWPTNYIAKAQNLKLMKNIEGYNFNDGVKRGNLAILIWNLMNTKVWEIKGETSDGIVAAPGKTLLETIYPEKVDEVNALIKELSEILPTDITLSKTKTTTCIGANGVDTKLRCSVLTEPIFTPENVTDKTITWTSSDDSIVSIKNGYIIAKQKGKIVLTAETVNGLTANCDVEIVDHQCFTSDEFKYDADSHWQMSVCSLCLDDIEKVNIENHTFVNGVCKCGKKEPRGAISAMNFETDIMNLEIGDTKQLNLKITPSNASEKIKYTSSDEDYVTVNSTGKIKAKKTGKIVTITAKSSSGKTATCKVVVPKSIVSKMVLGKSLAKDGLNSDDIWVSSDESVATFEGEKYVAKKLGKCKLTAYLKDNPDIVTTEIEIEVVETLGSMSIEVKGGKSYTLEVGEKIDLEAEIISTVENNDGSRYKLTWKSSDSNIVVVNGNNRKAKLTAKNPGTCNVVVSCEGMQTTIKVNVIDPNALVEYDDVKEDDWFEKSVKYVTNNNLMNGMGENQFSPKSNMTRGMLVTVLYRMSNSSYNGKSTFVDVSESEYYSTAVAWAAENKIVNGVGNNSFNPNAEVTREQLVVILYRYAKTMKINTNTTEKSDISSYDDFNEISEYSVSAFQWGYERKIISGRTSSTLVPKGTASRAEVATMLMRFKEN